MTLATGLTLAGSELRVGDTIKVWWKPGQDTILSLEPYRGPYEHGILKGARIASFAIGPGMTIEAGQQYGIVARREAR